jgi:hypothetical protein
MKSDRSTPQIVTDRNARRRVREANLRQASGSGTSDCIHACERPSGLATLSARGPADFRTLRASSRSVGRSSVEQRGPRRLRSLPDGWRHFCGGRPRTVFRAKDPEGASSCGSHRRRLGPEGCPSEQAPVDHSPYGHCEDLSGRCENSAAVNHPPTGTVGPSNRRPSRTSDRRTRGPRSRPDNEEPPCPSHELRYARP